MILTGVILMLAAFGCGKQKYNVQFDGHGFVSKKTSYCAGERVTVRYDMIATDTDYHFSIDDDVDMKQSYDGGYVFTFVMPEHDVTLHVSSKNSMVYIPRNEIWDHTEEPVSLRYDRMWIYSAVAETEDAELIRRLTYAIAELDVGDSTEKEVMDYTDLLTFTFLDGTSVRIEFEENMWVAEDGIRYEVRGLDEVRSLLEELID